jgi:hypothetical protein
MIRKRLHVHTHFSPPTNRHADILFASFCLHHVQVNGSIIRKRLHVRTHLFTPTPQDLLILSLLLFAFFCQVNGRIIRKRLHVRIEHVQPSRCREDFLRRRETNDRIKHEAKVKGGEKRWALRCSGVVFCFKHSAGCLYIYGWEGGLEVSEHHHVSRFRRMLLSTM